MTATVNKLVRALTAVTAAVVLTSCEAGKDDGGPPPLVPMPANVPAKPVYKDSDDVVRALGSAGFPCRVLRRAKTDPRFGTSLDCEAEIDGTAVENEVHVSNPDGYERDRIGDAIASRRKAPYSHTLVAAGNWYVRVMEPRYAPRIAQALHGVVLRPEADRIPDYPLPSIPAEPRYKNVGALADALDAAVGCADRTSEGAAALGCTTGKRTGTPNCATLALHDTPAERDRTLREAIAYKGVPATLVAAGNWTVNLCDYGLGERVARALHGRVVRYDGG
ncbi:hypothetical protein ABT104_06530 [Streptomyces mobaraensis]|uniref:hypothetical protein n=1 Tax=Streptomyces mobaraensis TaxID=35621 RepID=UPI0033172981